MVLDRLSLGYISELVLPEKVELIGEMHIFGSRWNSCTLTIQTPTEKRVLNNESISRMTRQQLLEYSNELLKKENQYLAEVEYTPSEWGGFFPVRLKGKLYQTNQRLHLGILPY